MSGKVYIVTYTDGDISGVHDSSGGAIQEVRDTVTDDHHHDTGIVYTYNEETGGIHATGPEGEMDITAHDVKP
jgi:hypothetical protein